MSSLVSKSFENADDVKSLDKTHAAVVKLGKANVTKLVLEPGWIWSECVRPAVGGGTCQAHHVGVIVQGRMKCMHDDGSEAEISAGDAYYFSPGHDGMVIGDETVIMYEFAESGTDFGPWKKA